MLSSADPDRIECLGQLIVFDYQLDLELGQEVDNVFRAAIQLCMTLLPPETLDLVHRHSSDSDGLQLLFHRVERKGLDNRFDLFHSTFLIRRWTSFMQPERAKPTRSRRLLLQLPPVSGERQRGRSP